MVERLIRCLQLLAADAEAQVAHVRSTGAGAHGIALDFEDAFRLVSDCPQLLLEPGQQDRLSRVEAYLSRGRLADGRSAFWREVSMREDPEWLTLRTLAADALASLGAHHGVNE